MFWAHLEYDADRLVPEHVTRTHERTEHLVEMKIRTADVGAGDLDDRVVGLFDNRVGDLFDKYVAPPCQVTAFIPASWLTPVITRQMRAGLWSHLQHASVHHPRCAGHVTGLRACQECNHSCDFARIPGRPERDTEPFFLVRILIFLTGHRGSDLAGRDGVRGNAVLAELECKGLDQSAMPCLAASYGPEPTRG